MAQIGGLAALDRDLVFTTKKLLSNAFTSAGPRAAPLELGRADRERRYSLRYAVRWRPRLTPGFPKSMAGCDMDI
jgi:hypothetical protein